MKEVEGGQIKLDNVMDECLRGLAGGCSLEDDWLARHLTLGLLVEKAIRIRLEIIQVLFNVSSVHSAMISLVSLITDLDFAGFLLFLC